ncbi:Cobalamin import ATP-binding protein BtuD [Candidatus Gugararchaeum adminiculabundum]|nr:Cobalamin import ATP-binding protein BtuD [Candidatus Gugararchaeum adminiculabundum]
MSKLRIAVIDRDKCTNTKCGYICHNVCPVERMNTDCVVVPEKKDEKTNPNYPFPVILEDPCTACGLCVKKCPVDCIKIINLAREAGTLMHQYGVNTFRLYNLPLPRQGVVGLIGSNGTGKTTALKILSGAFIPNMGDFKNKATWEFVISKFENSPDLRNYFTQMKNAKLSYKPQNVDRLSEVVKGKVKDLLKKSDQRKVLDEVIESFDLGEVVDRDIKNLSGGELQRVAISAAYMKDADVYFFDEPSSYLDIDQRLRVARAFKKLGEQKKIIVVEHDLAVLDYSSDFVQVFYGTPGAYGVVSAVKGVRSGINEFLDGYLKDENVRFRQNELKFTTESSGAGERKGATKYSYPEMKKTWKDFKLEISSGSMKAGEVIGIVGRNAIGKTSFMKLIAGADEPDKGSDKPEKKFKVSYKPQYIQADFSGTVQELFDSEKLVNNVLNECMNRLAVRDLLLNQVKNLSGGELQRVAITLALSRDADVYLFDEPSAFLDVEQRLHFSHLLRSVIENSEKCAFVIDHDIVLVDSVSSRLIVFDGKSSVHGESSSPQEKREGMNSFLAQMNVTLRRDRDTKRPRVNKLDSKMDREQKEAGEYYYYEK